MKILVTGGAHRLGGAIVDGLARDGHQIAIHYRSSADQARDQAESITKLTGASPVLLKGDLCDVSTAKALAGRAAEKLEGLDAVVNSASVFERSSFDAVDQVQWDQTFDLNLRSYFFVAQGAAPYLKRATGTLINISDIAAFDTWTEYIPHSIAKSGVEALTRLLALELAPEIRVNGIAPGAVLVPAGWDDEARRRRAERSPLKRLGQAEDVVRAVRYLLDARYVTGTTLVVDGGQLVNPRDRLDE